MAEQFDPHPPEPVWKLGPLGIKRTADFLALVAFILSLGGIIVQVRDHVRGPSIKIFGTDLVTLGSKAFEEKYPNCKVYVCLVATMSYVNDAPIGYNGTVRREYVRLRVGGKKIQNIWHDVVNTGTASNGRPTIEKVGNAGPFPVNAGSSLSHEVLFEPSEVECPNDDEDCIGSQSWMLWEDFIAAIKEERTIRVTLLAEVYGRGTTSVRCTVSLTQDQFQGLKDSKDKGWVIPRCKEDKTKSFF